MFKTLNRKRTNICFE